MSGENQEDMPVGEELVLTPEDEAKAFLEVLVPGSPDKRPEEQLSIAMARSENARVTFRTRGTLEGLKAQNRFKRQVLVFSRIQTLEDGSQVVKAWGLNLYEGSENTETALNNFDSLLEQCKKDADQNLVGLENQIYYALDQAVETDLVGKNHYGSLLQAKLPPKGEQPKKGFLNQLKSVFRRHN